MPWRERRVSLKLCVPRPVRPETAEDGRGSSLVSRFFGASAGPVRNRSARRPPIRPRPPDLGRSAPGAGLRPGRRDTTDDSITVVRRLSQASGLAARLAPPRHGEESPQLAIKDHTRRNSPPGTGKGTGTGNGDAASFSGPPIRPARPGAVGRNRNDMTPPAAGWAGARLVGASRLRASGPVAGSGTAPSRAAPGLPVTGESL